MTRERGEAAGIAVAVGVFVVIGLEYSGGYYALSTGILGGIVAIAAASLLALGFTPSKPALFAASILVALGAWSACSTVWGGLPHLAWRFGALTLAAAAALIAGSALARRSRTVLRGVLIGLAAHTVYVLATVGSGSTPAEWFRLRQLEGPIGYHNGEATIAAMGVPLALWAASSGRRVERSLGAAGAVLFLAVAFLTQSRGSIAAIALAVLLQLALARRARLAALAAFLFACSVVLFLSLRAVDRALIDDRPLDDPAFSRYVLLALLLALAGGGLSLISLPPLRLTRKQWYSLAGAGAVLAIASVTVAAAIVVPRLDSLRTRLTAEPNQPSKVAAGDTRLSSFSPTGRIELWGVALDMSAEKPVAGYGTGTFTRRWTIDRTNKDAYVLQPHSLELEMLAELGAIGLLLLLTLVGGIAWCVRRGIGSDRAAAAAAAGSLGVFFLISSVDWIYGFAGLLIPAMLIAGTVSGYGHRRVPTTARTCGYVIGLLATLMVLAGPAAAQYRLDQARSQLASSLATAARTASSARSWNRWDPAVVDFQGFLADQDGRFVAAAALYHRAAELSAQPWTESYREAEALRKAGRLRASRAACRRAIAANPLEPDLQRAVCDGVE